MPTSKLQDAHPKQSRDRGDSLGTAGQDVILDYDGLAERLGVTTRTVKAWKNDGKLPYFKIGKYVKFSWADVLAFLRKHNREIKGMPAPAMEVSA